MSLYAPLFRRVLFPLYESGLRGRKTLRYLDEYERNQSQDEEALRALQWQKLQRLLRHCWEQVPFYRRTWGELGIRSPEDIRGLDDYARLPLLDKPTIRANFEALVAANQRAGRCAEAQGPSVPRGLQPLHAQRL